MPRTRHRWHGAVLAGAALACTFAALARAATEPSPGAPSEALHHPSDSDERGLWQVIDEEERGLRTSPTVIRDPVLNAYVRSVLCKTIGADKCRNVRLYIMHTSQFNAAMAPNGMLQVWSGLLLRAQNEAQLAAVLGHEYTHFEQRHTLRLWRALRSKSNAAGWFSMLPFGGVVGLGLIASVFSFRGTWSARPTTAG